MSDKYYCHPDRIAEALDGCLKNSDLEKFYRHLVGCEECSRMYRENLGLSHQLRSLPQVDAPADLMESVRSALKEKTAQKRNSRVASSRGWLSLSVFHPWQGFALVGAACLLALLLWHSQPPLPLQQEGVLALELQSVEEVAGLDLEMSLADANGQFGEISLTSDTRGFLFASSNRRGTLRVSMASDDALHPNARTRILEIRFTHERGSQAAQEAIRLLSARAYRTDGRPARVEIRTIPMLPTPDSKLNTTA